MVSEKALQEKVHGFSHEGVSILCSVDGGLEVSGEACFLRRAYHKGHGDELFQTVLVSRKLS